MNENAIQGRRYRIRPVCDTCKSFGAKAIFTKQAYIVCGSEHLCRQHARNRGLYELDPIVLLDQPDVTPLVDLPIVHLIGVPVKLVYKATERTKWRYRDGWQTSSYNHSVQIRAETLLRRNHFFAIGWEVQNAGKRD